MQNQFVPYFVFALVAGDAFFVFQTCNVYIPLQFYSIAAWKMSLPSWAEEFLDHTGNAEKIKIMVENAVFTFFFHFVKITKYYHCDIDGKKKEN